VSTPLVQRRTDTRDEQPVCGGYNGRITLFSSLQAPRAFLSVGKIMLACASDNTTQRVLVGDTIKALTTNTPAVCAAH
jgi:hypothetical protein